ncbi:hypothetical protein PM10SUCC1_19210 [Propionigenium maris DSM 9537]|uniref:Uncharacterized protein n=1 Tax=Propionigenium maris DSM 9537 TaxID=1123000 RepID=A0A9W6GLG0_9FUSO|nr:hypothetical protein [Propionigenium maris]GLI56407.1 hypothetical protein PM10SUCC1_19210 [Propionigenium maris DSM 9537]
MKKIIFILLVLVNINGYAFEGINDLSFKEEPFINPKIIEDMSTWISDTGDQVVAINLRDSQDSNRYYCDYKVRESEDGFPYVEYRREEGEGGFGYQYIGELEPNTHVVKVYNNGGGSYTFVELMFIEILKSNSITYDIDDHKIKKNTERTLLHKIGSMPVKGRGYTSFYVEDGQLYKAKY